MSGESISYNPESLRRVCDQHGVAKLELFGSGSRSELRADSDVDLLCTLKPGTECTLLGWADLQMRLEGVFGRRVDLVSRRAIERSRNRIRREAILSEATPIYVAR